MADALTARHAAAGLAARPRRAASQTGMVLHWVEDEAGLAGLAGEWDDLVLAAPRPSPFLCWNWVYSWWQQFGRDTDLRVLTARDPGGRLIGLAPLHRVRSAMHLRSLELLGYRGSAVCADHLDFLARPPEREPVMAALIAAVLQRQDWDVFVLADLAEDSLLPRLWPREPGLVVEQRPAETCYFLPLPRDLAGLWQAIQPQHPEFFRTLWRYRRRLERHYATRFVPVTAPAEISATLAHLVRLHRLSRARQQQPSHFDLDDYRGFHERLIGRLAAGGQLYLARLECEQRVVAALYGFFQAGVLYYYQSGFDTGYSRDGVGKLLLASVLEDAVVRLGATEFDFLRGSERYKTNWTSQAHQTSTLLGWRGGLGARLHHWQWRARRQLAAVRAGWATRSDPQPHPRPAGGVGR